MNLARSVSVVHRRQKLWRAAVAAIALCGSIASAEPKALDVQALFYPGAGCADAVIQAVNSARWYLYFQTGNGLSNTAIKALIAAKKRGVHVEVILDKSQKNGAADTLNDAGIKTYLDTKHGGPRTGVVIVDEAKVVTGVFDFSKSADDTNVDNLLVISDVAIAAKYLENWRSHVEHASLFGAKRR